MLAHKIFFTILLSFIVNNSFLFCMENTIAQNKTGAFEKYTETVTLETRGFLSKPLPKSVPLLELPEIPCPDFSAIQELSIQIAKLKSLMSSTHAQQTKEQKKQFKTLLASLRHTKRTIELNWEKEVFSEYSKKAIHPSLIINFENNTESILRIDKKALKPKEKAQIEVPLVPHTNRLSVCDIPIYSTMAVQLFPRGPIIQHEKNKAIAVIRGIKDQRIADLPYYCFHTESFIGEKQHDDSYEDNKNDIQGDENTSYYGAVILEEDLNNNLNVRVGIGTTLYDAVKNIQKNHELPHAKAIKPQDTISTESLTAADHRAPSPEEQSTIMADEESSLMTIKIENVKRALPAAAAPIRPRGGIGISQSTSNVGKKPAFPSAKDVEKTEQQATKKHGSLISYGSLRKVFLTKADSLRNVKEAK